MNLKQMLAIYGITVVLMIVVYAAVLAGAVWLVVTLLKSMGVL